MSKWFFLGGFILIGLGTIIWLFEKAGLPLFKLPGDLHYKGENFQVYFPIATSIFLSVLLTFLFWLFRKA